MADNNNVIQIKHGPSMPGDGVLKAYELGYVSDEGYLVIGVPNGSSTETSTQPIAIKNALAADKLSTPRTIQLTRGGTSDPISFDGSTNINIPIKSIREAYLSWGGQGIANSISPVDCAASNLHSANRFAFADSAGITVEYSTDNGATYFDYGMAASDRVRMVSGINGVSAVLGRDDKTNLINNRLRITFNGRTEGKSMNVYARLRKLLIQVSSPLHSVKVLVEQSTYGNPTTFSTLGEYQLAGWSGWNSIPLGALYIGHKTSDIYSNLRLTFYYTALSSSNQSSNASILKIVAIGDECWAWPSTMALTGHLYDYDVAKNATFPNDITASGDIVSKGTITATKFIGELEGNATSATKATTATTATNAINDQYGNEISQNYINYQDLGVDPQDGIIPIAHGGHGASTAEGGLKNLLENGKMILSSKQYGSTLPKTDLTDGQIFYLIN